MHVQAVRGFRDILPEEIPRWQHLEATARRVFETYGFREIRPPLLEYTEVFTRSIGEATDIVEKEMYTFQDRSGRSVTLRPEGTASVVRAYVEHHLHAAAPVSKLYYLGPMFRHERPQAGRLRQFHQVGVEAIGVADPGMDVEVLDMLMHLTDTLGLQGLELQINSLGCPACRPEYLRRLQEYLGPRVSRLCESCQRRFRQNPLRILDCKVPACQERLESPPSILEHLCPACRQHHQAVRDGLAALGIPAVDNPRMVRGLDYYTRTAFELLAEGLGAQNAVAAGGRYDGLVAELGGPDVPGIGFALGVERLVSLMPQPTARRRPLVFLAALGAEAEARLLPVLQALRRQGIPAERDYGGKSLKSQLRRAHRLGAAYAVILGEEELGRGVAALRDMVHQSQEDVPLDRLVPTLVSRVEAPAGPAPPSQVREASP